ncbi:MAG: HAMP domain-containing protein, partial [Chloroflexi bacterium]|nr:HAMP domain-containing protein [Chloroflexota bacterium]
VGGITAVGVLVATALAWALGRYVARPLERLAAAAEEIGEGHLDREITLSGKDEVGVLADSFNRMVRSLREALSRERTRNRELTALNAVGQVVSLGEELHEVLARSLEEVVDALHLKGAWIVLWGEGEDEPADLVAVVGIDRSLVEGCADRLGMYCGCRRALKAAAGAGESDPPGQCSVPEALGSGFALLGPFPLVSGGRQLGFLSAVLPSGAELDPQDQEILAGVARQLGVALERSLLWRRLLEREERVSQLLQRVIDAQEEERRRIARELHDETSQSMAALTVGLKVASSLIERDPRRAERILEGLKEATALTLREIHNIVYDLRPTLLDDMGLVPALHWCATRWLSEQGVEVEVTAEGLGQRLPQQVETTLYRIGQEAINNVAKHAGARHVSIYLEGEKGQVRLSVADDGRGFAGAGARRDHGEKPSLGLVGMAERASLLGGECTVTSVPGEGTRVAVTIPLPEGGVFTDQGAVGG